jgi:hypothetical protein
MPVNKKIVILATSLLASANAFTSVSTQNNIHQATSLNASPSSNDNEVEGRRSFMKNVAGLAFGAAGLVASNQPASASYSAYTNREKDWAERKESGDINYSRAIDLKAQLREIAPMNNDAKSLVFCPNGPSSAVSPLMENKCSDKLATPSVFGRTEDIVGNSVPGFAGGRYTVGGTSTLSAADTGGFPSYPKAK